MEAHGRSSHSSSGTIATAITQSGGHRRGKELGPRVGERRGWRGRVQRRGQREPASSRSRRNAISEAFAIRAATASTTGRRARRRADPPFDHFRRASIAPSGLQTASFYPINFGPHRQRGRQIHPESHRNIAINKQRHGKDVAVCVSKLHKKHNIMVSPPAVHADETISRAFGDSLTDPPKWRRKPVVRGTTCLPPLCRQVVNEATSPLFEGWAGWAFAH